MSDYREQQQASANDTASRDEGIENALKEVHTALPGIIASFDPATQTASVQPCIQRIFTENGPVNIPLCVDVPVHFPKAGGLCITIPVKQGDECTIFFYERAIDRWFQSGGIQEPSEYRMHDYSDGYAIVGVSSMPNVIPNFDPDNIEIRTLDGSIKIQLGTAGVKIFAEVEITGSLKVNGTTDLIGNTAVVGTMMNNGVNVGSDHDHGNVQNGGGRTDGPA